MAEGNNGNGAFWASRKFWMEVLAAGLYLALALTHTVEFTPWQHVILILGITGISVGGHAGTDIAAIIAQALAARGSLGGLAGSSPSAAPGDTIVRDGADDDDGGE